MDLLVVPLFIICLILGFGLLAALVRGALDSFESFGLWVIVGWIFAFPVMTTICVIWGISAFWNRNAAVPISLRQYRPHEEASVRVGPLILEEEKIAEHVVSAGIRLVQKYESHTPHPNRSKMDFRFYADSESMNEYMRERWSRALAEVYQAHPFFKARNGIMIDVTRFIEKLPYPDFVPSDLENAVRDAPTEVDFIRRHSNLISAFNGIYEKNPKWAEQEAKILSAEAKRNDVRRRMGLSEE